MKRLRVLVDLAYLYIIIISRSVCLTKQLQIWKEKIFSHCITEQPISQLLSTPNSILYAMCFCKKNIVLTKEFENKLISQSLVLLVTAYSYFFIDKIYDMIWTDLVLDVSWNVLLWQFTLSKLVWLRLFLILDN